LFGFTVFLLITSLVCLIMVSIPALTFVMAIIWGAVLIIAGLYLEKGRVPIIFGINILLLYGTAGSGTVFFYLTFFGLAAFIMSFLVNAKEEYYKVQKWGIISAVVGVSFFLGFFYFGTGEVGISTMESQLKSYLTEAVNDQQAAGLLDFYEDQGISRIEIEESITTFATTLARHLPAFYYLQAILAGFFMLSLASYISIKCNREQLRKKPFEEEIMPWQLAWVVIIGLGLWLWGREQMSFIYYTGSNILVVLIPITVYYGFSIIIYKIRQQKPGRRKWIIIIMLILTIVFPLSAIIFSSLLGLFDSLLDYRKLRFSKP